jgi:25S rRNA (cytosine2278-C5)-methyltransferase
MDRNSEQRLEKLAAFQLKMVQHSMKFPSVEKIVYSTCSIHATENEHVGFAALRSKEAIKGGFTLAPRTEMIPTWPRRGLEEAASNDDERKREQSSGNLQNPLTIIRGWGRAYRWHA